MSWRTMICVSATFGFGATAALAQNHTASTFGSLIIKGGSANADTGEGDGFNVVRLADTSPNSMDIESGPQAVLHSTGDAGGEGFAFANLENHSMGVLVRGYGDADHNAGMNNDLYALAKMTDYLNLSPPPESSFSSRVRVKGYYHLDGNVQAQASGILGTPETPYEYRNVTASAAISVSGTGFTSVTGGSTDSWTSYDPSRHLENRHDKSTEQAPSDIFFDFETYPYLDTEFTVQMIAQAYLQGEHDYFGAPSISGSEAAEFSHTLSFGGITSITDAFSGEELTGWSISSASGFTYLPEPGMLMSTLVGLLAGGRIRRQGKCGQKA